MDIFKLYFDEELNLIIQVSIWFLLLLILIFIIYFFIMKKVLRYNLVKVNIKLGNVGTAEFRPNKNDIQIAHKIWTQLVTRKAAIPIDQENDVIEEIYDSWYALFQKVREFISEIPADMIRSNNSTKEIVRIATQTLNEGLRPHLTKWQARFRSWSTAKKDKLLELTPQDFQKEYPEYKYLIEDLIQVNQQIQIHYTNL